MPNDLWSSSLTWTSRYTLIEGMASTGMITGKLPAFRKPPVVEVVLGVQFNRPPAISNAQLGAFWKHLSGKWPNVSDANPIEQAFERFGAEHVWSSIGGSIKLSQEQVRRLQISNADRTRMIQVQSNRFHLNWRGYEGGAYPRYGAIRPEFDALWKEFRDFLSRESVGDVIANQWEVTYVNHIPKGSVWTRADDWRGVIVGLPIPATSPDPMLSLDSFNGEWHYVIGDEAGRVHVNILHGRTADIAGSRPEIEILRVMITARGPIGDTTRKGLSLDHGLDLGHEAVVRCFAGITSEKAHQFWERIQ